MPLSPEAVMAIDRCLDWYLESRENLTIMPDKELEFWLAEIGANYPNLQVARISELRQLRTDVKCQFQVLLGLDGFVVPKSCGCGRCDA
jgi:hypothetical protein